MTNARTIAAQAAAAGFADGYSATPNLSRAARAYANGDEPGGDRLFHAAFLDIAPLVRMGIAHHLDASEDREDAFQNAMASIWSAARSGRVAHIDLYSRGAAIDRYRREDRHARRRAGAYVDDPELTDCAAELRDADTGGALWASTPDHADGVDATIDADQHVDQLAVDAGKIRARWEPIVRLLAAGLTQAEAARVLDTPPGTVTRNVVELRAWIATRGAA